LNTPESEVPANLNITVKKGLGHGEFRDMAERALRIIVESTKSVVVQPVSEEVIGGVDFLTFITSTEIGRHKIYAKVYAFRRNDHSISISISYAEQRGFQLMDNVLKGIEFF
jgi:hypothetical protein